MAELKGVRRTLADNPIGSDVGDPGYLNGKIRTIVDYYEMDGDEVALDTIEIGKRLPKGSIIVEVIIQTEKLADTCTLHLGDKEDADRYVTSFSGITAGMQRMEADVADSLGHRVVEDDEDNLDSEIILTFATLAADIVDAARVTVVVLYTYE